MPRLSFFWPIVGRLGLLLVLLNQTGGAGCCGSTPTVQVQFAQVRTVNLNGVWLDVVCKVTNSNSFDVQVRNVNMNVILANNFNLGPINYSPNVWLPSDQTTMITVPTVVPWNVVPGLLAHTLGNDMIPYQAVGTADVTATRSLGIQLNKEPINETGQVSREKLLQAARTMIPGAR